MANEIVESMTKLGKILSRMNKDIEFLKEMYKQHLKLDFEQEILKTLTKLEKNKKIYRIVK